MSKPRSRITAEQRAEVLRRRKAGQPMSEIARALGISAGSVHNIAREAQRKPPRSRATLPQDASGAPTTTVESSDPGDVSGAASLDDVRRSLSGLASQLSALASAAEREGDSAALLSASRTAATVLVALSRLTPPPIEESGLMLVDRAEMEASGGMTIDKLRQMMGQLAAAHRGPRCESCGQHVTTTTTTTTETTTP